MLMYSFHEYLLLIVPESWMAIGMSKEEAIDKYIKKVEELQAKE